MEAVQGSASLASASNNYVSSLPKIEEEQESITPNQSFPRTPTS